MVRVSNTVDDCLQRQIAQKIFKSKIKARPVKAGHYKAFKHFMSFATNLAANFGFNQFRIIPDIVSKTISLPSIILFLPYVNFSLPPPTNFLYLPYYTVLGARLYSAVTLVRLTLLCLSVWPAQAVQEHCPRQRSAIDFAVKTFDCLLLEWLPADRQGLKLGIKLEICLLTNGL